MTSIPPSMLDPGYTNPELAEILAKSGPTPKLDVNTDIHALRAYLANAKNDLAAASSGGEEKLVKQEDLKVPTRDGNEIGVRVYKRVDQEKTGPVLVFLHGGGWSLGGLDSDAVLCRRWCTDFGGITVTVDYRLAPEHKFPTAVHDSYDALVWIAANAASIGGDLKAGFIVSGISAGGNLTAVVSHLYRDDGHQPPLTGAWLSIPSTLDPDAVPDHYKADYRSHEENKNAAVLDAGAVNLFRKLYAADPKSPLVSPLLWPSGHKNLPKTYFQICGQDPLRDDGILYERALQEAGVETKVDWYPGLPHGFNSFFADAQFTKDHFEDSLKGLGWLLHGGQSGK